MPTASPFFICSGSICSSVSSTRIGSPKLRGVAAASTYCQRGVITAVPNETLLGFTRCTFTTSHPLCDELLANSLASAPRLHLRRTSAPDFRLSEGAGPNLPMRYFVEATERRESQLVLG